MVNFSKMKIEKRQIDRIFLIVIILLGAYFRLSYIEFSSFRPTQGMQLLTTKKGLDEGCILKTSVRAYTGLKHGAILQYLLNIPMIFSKTPEVSIWFFSLLSVITIYMVFRIGNDFFLPR